jgi:3-hydroxyacyl-CoA dehydrogenase
MGNTSTVAAARKKVVVLGANGAMGAGAAAMFAAGGCDVTLVARDIAKSLAAIATAQGITKSEFVATQMQAATYDQGMPSLLAGADIIFEALAEDMDLKRQLFAQIDSARPADAVVASVSSGLSIRAMADGRSPGFRAHFAGIHLYNPPHVMTATELIPHPDMEPALASALSNAFDTVYGRAMVTCADMPAFAGNRIGFKVLNEVAHLATKHGVQLMDALIGPYTGRAMAPLATVDLVGWDVHKAIVDNVAANVTDEAPGAFALPAYMADLIAKGHLGDKTPLAGGFFKKSTREGKAITEALDPSTGAYTGQQPITIPFVEAVKDLNRRGRYRDAMACFMSAEDPQADIARRVILGYVSYALHRVGRGEVVAEYADVDRIMTAGFNWAPPSGLVDLIGAEVCSAAMQRYGIPVPALIDAARRGEVPSPLFKLPSIALGRYFAG